jgi:hypothetical protein
MWTSGASNDDIFLALNAIPGRRDITDRKTLSKRAETLGVKRPAWYLLTLKQHMSAAGNAVSAKNRTARKKPRRRSVPAPKVERVVASMPAVTVSATRTCQWIEGDPRHAVFCGAPAVVGRSWCPEHASRVFSNWEFLRTKVAAMEQAENELSQ